ncbi:hypothetical protein ABIF67_004485 [Bradyrhizobium japonicum]
MAYLREVRLCISKRAVISKGEMARKQLSNCRRPGARSEPGTHTHRMKFGED